MDKYLVIWANILEEFDDFGEAMNHAQTQTFEEIHCNTAMIISINKDEDAELTTAEVTMVTWLRHGTAWMVTELGAF